MKKTLLAMALCLVCALMISCQGDNHTVKYDNGNVDTYVHKKGTTEYVITMKNGDNTDGTIKLTDNTGTAIEQFKIYKDIASNDPKMSKEDHIVRLVKTAWIYTKNAKLAHPATAKFNGNSCSLMVDNGELIICYDLVCQNGLGVEENAHIFVKYNTDTDESEPTIL